MRSSAAAESPWAVSHAVAAAFLTVDEAEAANERFGASSAAEAADIAKRLAAATQSVSRCRRIADTAKLSPIWRARANRRWRLSPGTPPLRGTRRGPRRRQACTALAHFLRVGGERARELDAILIGEGGVRVRATAVDGVDNVGRIQPVVRQQPRARYRVGHGRAGWKRNCHDILQLQRRPDDGDSHGGAAYTTPARRTNASMKVFAMWLNTGPTTFSSKCVVNS